MAKNTDLLLRAAGEIQLPSARGDFFQSVAGDVDLLVEAALAPKFVQVAATNNQTIVSEGDIRLDTVVSDGGVAYDPATGLFSLVGGRLYRLDFFGRWTNFSDTVAGSVFVFWTKANNVPLFNNAMISRVFPVNGERNDAANPVIGALYRPAVNESVKLRASVEGAVENVTLRGAGESWAVVHKVG